MLVLGPELELALALEPGPALALAPAPGFAPVLVAAVGLQKWQ